MSNKEKKVSEHIGKYVQMNIDLAGFKAGQRWLYDLAPDIIKKWADLPGVYGSTRIVTVLDKIPESEQQKDKFKCPKCGYVEGDPIEPAETVKPEKTLQETNQEKINNSFADEVDPKNRFTRKCKGQNLDGSPCKFTGKKVLENGYCIKHQHQYVEPLTSEAG